MYGVWEGGERWDLYRTSHLSHNNEFEHIHITSWTSSELYFGIQISSRLVLLSSENSQRKAIIGAVDKVKEAYVIFLNLASLQSIPSKSNNCQSIQKIKLSIEWMKDQVTVWLAASHWISVRLTNLERYYNNYIFCDWSSSSLVNRPDGQDATRISFLGPAREHLVPSWG
jgi:hypothetical protein